MGAASLLLTPSNTGAKNFTVRVFASSVEDAPIDRARAAVLVACRRHYRVFPPDTVAEVRVHAADGGVQVTRYAILHRFESADD